MKGVYKKPSGNYCVVTWDSLGKLEYHGTFNDEAEATKRRNDIVRGHHWEGLTPDPSKYGFIYSVVDLDTEQLYIGRRIYMGYNKESGKRDIESGWEFYCSSSRVVEQRINQGHRMSYTILANTESNDHSSYLEHELIKKYIYHRLPSGTLMSLNGVIPKLFVRGLEEAKAMSEDDLHRLEAWLP